MVSPGRLTTTDRRMSRVTMAQVGLPALVLGLAGYGAVQAQTGVPAAVLGVQQVPEQEVVNVDGRDLRRHVRPPADEDRPVLVPAGLPPV